MSPDHPARGVKVVLVAPACHAVVGTVTGEAESMQRQAYKLGADAVVLTDKQTTMTRADVGYALKTC